MIKILNIIALVDKNVIEIILPGGKDELIASYSFVTGTIKRESDIKT